MKTADPGRSQRFASDKGLYICSWFAGEMVRV